MSIVSTKEMLQDAKLRKYAVPAFNIHNLETIRVVVEAAEKLKSPVILAATPSTVEYSGSEYLVAIAKAAASKHSIPIALHLDHYNDLGLIKKYIDIGFSSAMIDASHDPFEENVRKTSEIVEYAKKRGVTVEAELGRLVGQEDDLIVDEKDSLFTDPNLAAQFAQDTKIDSLAVAIGTAHGLYKSDPKLDFKRLSQIKDNVSIPLVLHGASGVPSESVKKAIDLGICKVNIATELKIPFANAVKKFFIENPDANDPRKYLVPGKIAMKEMVIKKIIMCKSDGMAS